MYYLQSCVCAPWSDGTVGGPSPVSSEGDDRRDAWTERTDSALARRFLRCRHPEMSARFGNRGWPSCSAIDRGGAEEDASRGSTRCCSCK
jgi:hypothetical protein